MFPKTLPALLSAALLNLSIATAADTESWRSSCDMRNLGLSPMQQAQLRQIRITYRNLSDDAARDSEQTLQRKKNLLEAEQFDESAAQALLLQKYRPVIRAQVDEMRVQFDLLKIMTPAQRDIWLRDCLR